MRYEVIKTNIVNVVADAIVLPANTSLKEGSGASRAIFEAAGRTELENACKQIGYCDVGKAVPTLAFHLRSKYIIHAVVPKWNGGEEDEYGLLGAAYLSALTIADKMGCETIAFPILTAGNNGFNPDVAYGIAVKCLESYEEDNLKKAVLVVFDRNMDAIARKYGEIPIEIISSGKRIAKSNKLLGVDKAHAQKVLEQQGKKALVFLLDEKNQKMLIENGKKIAKMVMAIKGM